LAKQITIPQRKTYWEKRQAGFSMRAAATAAGFSLTYARTLEKGNAVEARGVELVRQKQEEHWVEPLRYEQLGPEAKKAWDDFGYFQRRYFGRVPHPWQIEAAEYVVSLLETDDEEYVVINAPPGSGKTILFTHDIPAWLTVRNRAIRGQMGSVVGPLAQRYTNRLRRTLERTVPEKASAEELAAGTAFDAEATLAADYGRFKPLDRELWTADAFVVQQYSDVGTISEKEPTWSSYGIDQGFIGGRFNFVVWDDLVDQKKQRTVEAKEQLQQDYDDLCETRLEPGGLLVLQGQRLASDDLYRYNIDKKIPELIDPDTDEVLESSPMYHHLKFPAHYEDRCRPEYHKKGAPAYPVGCLLSPSRLPWRKLSARKAQRSERYEVVYQQEDVDPASVLVPKAWVFGSSEHPGCIDRDRDRLQLPSGLSQPLVSLATADPSPTRFWGVQWWIYHPESKQWFLMDILRQAMDAPDFLDWNANNNQWHGIMEEWQQTSAELGFPIRYWVVEINAAQRFLLQYDHVKRWQAARGVTIIPHSTNRNKTDDEYGVQMIAPHWEFGRIRLPFKRGFNSPVRYLIDEVTTWPNGRTDDCVMAEWFAHFQVESGRISTEKHAPAKQWRPSWTKQLTGRY